MGTIVTKEEFKNKIRPQIKKEGKTIALCHGVFDLVHPGHVIHFEQAHEMADVLVVSVTAARYVRKGPDRPYFNDEMRLKFLSAIGCIDYVLLSEGYTVEDIIESVEPDYYVKGSEYSKDEDDITGKIREERELVEAHGGELKFTSGAVFSSTKLINNGLSAISKEVREYIEEFKTRYSMEDIRKYADRAKSLKVLVVGDVIIDRYSYCNVQGLMSKDMGYSARLKYSEDYLGGSLAIARHLSSFSDNVTLMSVIGNEDEVKRLFDERLDKKIKTDFVISDEFPTIIKHRFLSRSAKREEYRKIFVINNIPEDRGLDRASADRFKERLKNSIKEYDAVFLCDFGHGLIDEESIGLIQDEARFLVLNCQTNSSNYGLNNITKYTRTDLFALDQKELKLAFPDEVHDEEGAFKDLGKYLKGNGWLTRGSHGAWGINNGVIDKCPAFTLTVKDTIGAGDAFYAASGMITAAGAPVEMGTLIGNIAGALCANVLGNKDSIDSIDVLKYANTLLNI